MGDGWLPGESWVMMADLKLCPIRFHGPPVYKTRFYKPPVSTGGSSSLTTVVVESEPPTKDNAMQRIETKSLAPHFRKLTRKKTVLVTVTDSVCLNDTEWSGGSRSVYSAIDPLSGSGLENHPDDVSPAGFPSFKPGRKVVETGRTVISTGTFCGKPASLHIYCSKQDLDLICVAPYN